MKAIARILIICLCLMMIPAYAFADDPVEAVRDGIKYRIESRQLTVIGYEGDLVDVEIPDSLEGYPVMAIEREAFANCKTLESIKIPDSVRTIGNCAFMGCSNLVKVTLPNGLTRIPDSCFMECLKLKFPEIPASVSEFGSQAFIGCQSLGANIKVPDTVKIMEDRVFMYCQTVQSVTLPESYDGDLPIDFFYGCAKLRSFTVSEKVNSIGEGAFTDCGYLSWVKFLNPDCQIFDAAGVIPEGTVICGLAGSTAEAYAKKYNRTFRELKDFVPSRFVKVRLSSTKYIYNGKVRKPAVIAYDVRGNKISKSFYKVKYDPGCKAIGTYKVTVNLIGPYAGRRITSFVIKPTKVTGMKATSPKSKQIRVTYNKAKGGVRYEISCHMKGAKKGMTFNTSKSGCIIKNLKGGRVYLVKVRAYKTVKGVTYTGAWTKEKTVKVKK